MSPDRTESRRGPSTQEIQLPPNEYALTRRQLEKLVQNNPGTDILNPRLIERKFGKSGEKFDPAQYDPPRVVWVQTRPDKKELLIEDGHHRTTTVLKHYEAIRRKYPDFQPVVRDVTASYLKDRTSSQTESESRHFKKLPPEMTLSATEEDYPQALTLEEYLDALVQPTADQKEIASQRTATMLIKSWESIIGSDELASKFSALAAFTYLERPELVKAKNEFDARMQLDKERVFFASDTLDERAKIREALLRTRTLLQRVEVKPREVAQATFVIISARKEFIGGEQSAHKQIAGLLYHPAIREKMMQAYGPGAELVEETQRLAAEIVQQLTIRGPKPDKVLTKNSIAALGISKDREIMYQALMDRRLTIQESEEVLKADHPQEKYTALVHQYNNRLLTKAYASRKNVTTLSSVEERLINDLCDRNISPVLIERTIHIISMSTKVIQSAEDLLSQLENNSTPEAETVKNEIRRKIRGISSHHMLSLAEQYLPELQRATEEAKLFIKGPGEEATVVYEQSLLGDQQVILDALRSLSPGLRKTVLSGQIALDEAIIRQRERNAAIAAGDAPMDLNDDEEERKSTSSKGQLSDEVYESPHLLNSVKGMKTKLTRLTPLDVTPTVREQLEQLRGIIDEKLGAASKEK